MTDPADIARALSAYWMPIETAPKTGEWFMTYTPGDEPWRLYDFACWIPESEGWGKVRCGFQYATHWMPLPEVPRPTSDASTDRNQAKVVRCGKEIE